MNYYVYMYYIMQDALFLLGIKNRAKPLEQAISCINILGTSLPLEKGWNEYLSQVLIEPKSSPPFRIIIIVDIS